ncbi:hypothetical protein NSK_003144 [Nannochloropsis salina CCMP1776]|uniref:Leucine carboxyl methyltransferase 1 n=1 Tax=Nannochloropsis salina CCMP1776 TaxID=1027361 RepID=A0A4D9D2M1_9STRA|nr:hypothetical protein NSK_003144 [Nannochloropsis salina CCMP1776]|eukprot:TFJ85636.1 hypothetical protein NSK_003144 [Nannochloropsis salina CCMP1776]
MEALNGKAACVREGYYRDRYIDFFRPNYPPVPRMSPLIKRGYFTRVRALQLIIDKFEKQVLASSSNTLSHTTEEELPQPPLPSPPRVNLVLLGAGLDTLFLRLREEEENAKKSSKHNVQAVTRFCYEVDFPPLMKYKAHCIWKNEELTSLLGVSPARETSPGGRPDSPTVGGASVILTSRRVTSSFREKKGGDGPRQQRSGCYILVAGDLAETAALERALEAAGIDWAVPTLLITECVLVYMEAEASRALVEWTAAKFRTAAWASYDMISPHDVFGRMMRSNLTARGLSLPGFETWGRSLKTQKARFVGGEEGGVGGGLEGGVGGVPWERAVGGDMNNVYDHFLLPEDRKKAATLEHLDEVEEWQMLMGHYCYVVATRGAAMKGFLQGQPGFK